MKNCRSIWLLVPILFTYLALPGCDANNQANRRAPREKIAQTLDDAATRQISKIKGSDKDTSTENNGDAITPQEESEPQQQKKDRRKSKAQMDAERAARKAEQESPDDSPLDRASRDLSNREKNDQQPGPPKEVEVRSEIVPLVETGWVRMSPQYEVWVDGKNRQVIIGGRISLNDGILEMFACPEGSKEHESVIATFSDASTVHLGLLGVGAIPGVPAYWTDDTGVVTAIGPKCSITIVWNEKGEGNEVTRRQANAKEFVLNQETGEELKHDWVFCGSRKWTNPDDPSHTEYQADWGDMICVSNFPSAMMDLTIESSTSDSGRLFMANPEKVPVFGQPVLIIIKPDLTTNPTEEVVATANKTRVDAEAKMRADMEARMKEREERWERERQKAEAERQKAEAENENGNESGNDKEKDKR